jgi:hypothetical protein
MGDAIPKLEWLKPDGKPAQVRCPDNLPSKSLDFLLEQSQRILDADSESMDRLATRSSTLLGVAISIVTGVVIVGLTQSGPVPHWVFGLISLTLLASASLAVTAYVVTWFQYPPDPELLGNAVHNSPSIDLRWDLFVSLVQAHILNHQLLQKKERLTNASLYVFAGSLGILLGAVAWLLL